jgi:hypothetical protein
VDAGRQLQGSSFVQDKTMTRTSLLHAGLASATLLTLALPASAAKSDAKPDDQALMRSAMSAAPAKVASGATLVAMEADGSMRTLRTGTNGFTCMPDNPATPGPDPMCMDANALAWAHAWIGHTTPEAGKIGFMYMLEGGTDASNTDPYATKPTEGNHWVKTGPHVMIVGADPAFYALYPRDADPDTSVPYVMWPDTPYQHLMIPVK